MEHANHIEHSDDKKEKIYSEKSPLLASSSLSLSSSDVEAAYSSSNKKRDLPTNFKHIGSVYRSVKENALTNSDYYLYAISIILLIVNVFILFINYKNMSSSGFLWSSLQFIVALINSWINTVSFLHKTKNE